MSVHEHKEKAKKSVRCFVITVSDTRDETTDTSGRTIKQFLADQGHQAAGYRIVKDEPVEIERLLNEALESGDVEVVIVNGGTGIAPRDGTYATSRSETLSMTPSEYFKRQIYATMWFERTDLPSLVKAVGEDNILSRRISRTRRASTRTR